VQVAAILLASNRGKINTLLNTAVKFTRDTQFVLIGLFTAVFFKQGKQFQTVRCLFHFLCSANIELTDFILVGTNCNGSRQFRQCEPN
jgi:hypothetical protein